MPRRTGLLNLNGHGGLSAAQERGLRGWETRKANEAKKKSESEALSLEPVIAEVEAMKSIAEIVQPFDGEARNRILGWARDRLMA